MKVNWKNFEIESMFAGQKKASWDMNGDSENRHHIISVKNLDTGKSCTFDFWTSIANPIITNERELLDAIDCYFSDASFGEGTFDDFCAESGYDVPKGILDTYNACKMANVCVTDVFGENWTDIANELSEEVWYERI